MTAPVQSKYFYIYYTAESQSHAFQGNTILRQLVDPSHTEDHGLNLASAHTWLLANFGNGIIISWQETTKLRYDQWMEFCAALETGKRLAQKKKPDLGVISGGKEQIDASAGPNDKPASLTIVVPEKKEPDPVA